MRARPTTLPDVLVLEPEPIGDDRGWFYESWNRRDLAPLLGRSPDFVQDNHSWSRRGVLRGLHYQLPQPQAKLIRTTRGESFHVAVDLRAGSPTFGRWAGERLSGENRRQLWVPEGFAHGFLVLAEEAEVLYKVTAHHLREGERSLRWDDPVLAIAWPDLGGPPVLSAKDQGALPFGRAPVYDRAGLAAAR